MSAICKRLICLVLCLLTVFSVTSCQLIESFFDKDETEKDVKKHDDSYLSLPEGYTGGFAKDPCMHAVTGFYWLETYEEVLEAISLLESHGSTFERSVGFDYEDGLLYSKWCFTYPRSKADPLEEGKDFFDRKIDGGEFKWFAFVEDIDIEEIYYERVTCCGFFSVCYIQNSFVDIDDTDALSIDWFGRHDYGIVDQPPEGGNYEVVYQDKIWVEINYNYEYPLPHECFDELLESVVIIE